MSPTRPDTSKWSRRRAGALVLLAAAPACAKGSTGEPYVLESGIYELLTMQVEGECVLDGALTSGAEHAGKAVRVAVDASARRVILEPCDEFFEDDCIPEAFVQPLSLLRDELSLHADEPAWEVPHCTCLEGWRGQRSAEGFLVADGSAELTWIFELPPPPAGCLCDAPAAACSATVVQRLDAL